MRPKKIELILVVVLITSGVLVKNNVLGLFLIGMFLSSALLSIYYLLFYGNIIKGDNGLLNFFVRWILALFPVAFSMMFVNADAARIVGLIYSLLTIIAVILKMKNNITDKYEIIRMYFFLIVISIIGQTF